jgi:hypothetical protein
MKDCERSAEKTPIRPESVQKYLEGKFGDALGEVSKAMLEPAKSFPASQLAEKAYTLYERNSGRKILPAKKGEGPPASWTWTSSAKWLRPDPEERLLNCPDLSLIRQTGSDKAMTRFSNSPTTLQTRGALGIA